MKVIMVYFNEPRPEDNDGDDSDGAMAEGWSLSSPLPLSSPLSSPSFHLSLPLFPLSPPLPLSPPSFHLSSPLFPCLHLVLVLNECLDL
jgi:hypothetical protein